MSNKVRQHPWGYEADWANQINKYGAKILMFPKQGAKTDMFFHSQTDKTWFVNAGSFSVKWIDTTNGRVYEQKLEEGNVFDIPALRPCSLESLAPNSSLTEVNSGFRDDDYFVVFPSHNVGV